MSIDTKTFNLFKNYKFDMKRYRDWEVKAKALGIFDNYEIKMIEEQRFGTVPLLFKCNTKSKILILPPVFSINSDLLKGNKYIEELVIDENILLIYSFAFSDCINLKKVTFNNKWCRLGSGTFANCENLRTVITNKCIMNIASYQFAYCRQLKDIDLGNNIISMGEKCFISTSIEKLTIPSSISKISCNIIRNCNNLRELTVKSENLCITLADENEYLFTHCNNIERVYVNKGSLYNIENEIKESKRDNVEVIVL